MKNALLKSFFACVLIFTLNSCSSDSAEELSAAERELVTDYQYSDIEYELADQINDYRVNHGLNRLELINHVSFKGQEHNSYMMLHKVVNHDQFEARAHNIMEVVGAVKVNENVAYNFQAPSGALNAWLNSPGHKANIEGNFTHFGISIKTDPETGKKYYTNIFVKK